MTRQLMSAVGEDGEVMQSHTTGGWGSAKGDINSIGFKTLSHPYKFNAPGIKLSLPPPFPPINFFVSLPLLIHSVTWGIYTYADQTYC